MKCLKREAKMSKFSKKSFSNLSTCHPDIQTVMEQVIEFFDFTVVYGHRSPEVQKLLFDQGRDKNGKIIDKKKVVTNCDGYKKPSKHNALPSEGIDIIKYPMDWEDVESAIYLAGFVIGISELLFAIGRISHKLKWGGDWDSDRDMTDQNFMDYFHFEVIK